MSYCPECEAAIDEEEIEDVGVIITCPECGTDLEVISIDPVEFDVALEDIDDDEYGYEEDSDEWENGDDSYTDDDDF